MTPSTLSFSKQQVAELLEGLRLPAAVISPDFEILVANRAYGEEFGRRGQGVEGLRCHHVTHGFERPCEEQGVRCPLRGATQTLGRCSVIHEHHGRHGPLREEVVAVPLLGADGEVAAYLETLRPLRVSGGRAQDQEMIGRSPPFLRMMDLIGRVAPTDTPVLLLGESGTGKELAARAVHRSSQRSLGAFVPVDCSGLAETLFESELLGHEKGAFTGATTAKRGLVEAASGGTLFLDEVGDVPLSQQVKLLRILETGFYRRVGSVEPRQADFRLVCATHRDLPAMVEAGDFRRDLYYRISAFPVRLPPLRERLGDLELLCERLLQRLAASSRSYRLSPATLDVLRTYRFPGNVRELFNILQRACLLAEDETIEPEHLPQECLLAAGAALPPEILWQAAGDPGEPAVLSLDEVERRYLARLAAVFPGERADLARRLGLSERTLYRKLAGLRQDPAASGRS